jgi:two-component system phosphate regulon response regulator PhoB
MLSRVGHTMRTALMAKKILVADDELGVRTVLENVLTSFEYEVLTAANGEEALALAEREKPEVILLDAIMPGIDGLETCRRLKTQEKTRGIPIIMMTGFGIMPAEAETVGAEDLVLKPFNIYDILMRISSICKVLHLTDPHERRLAYREELDRNRSEQKE